jgi:hypothetical protein
MGLSGPLSADQSRASATKAIGLVAHAQHKASTTVVKSLQDRFVRTDACLRWAGWGRRSERAGRSREGVTAKHGPIAAEASIAEDRRPTVGRSHVVYDQRT